MTMEMLLRDNNKSLLQTVLILCKNTTDNIRNHLLSKSKYDCP